jgi:hypothetical protein
VDGTNCVNVTGRVDNNGALSGTGTVQIDVNAILDVKYRVSGNGQTLGRESVGGILNTNIVS